MIAIHSQIHSKIVAFYYQRNTVCHSITIFHYSHSIVKFICTDTYKSVQKLKELLPDEASCEDLFSSTHILPQRSPANRIGAIRVRRGQFQIHSPSSDYPLPARRRLYRYPSVPFESIRSFPYRHRSRIRLSNADSY